MTRRKRHSKSQIAAKLEQADALAAEGHTQREIANTLGISVMTFHRWRKARPRPANAKPNGASVHALSALLPHPTKSIGRPSKTDGRAAIGELRLENARLRKLVIELLLERMQLLEDTQPQGNGRAGKSQSASESRPQSRIKGVPFFARAVAV